MRSFGNLVVTLFAVSAQVTLTSGAKFNIAQDLDRCMEVVISDDEQCSGNMVKYCLQPKNNTPSDCPGSYSHANVYVDGQEVHLSNDNAFPTASCTDGNPQDCAYLTGGGGDQSCKALDTYNTFPNDNDFIMNVGLKCENTTDGLCVTVPLVYNDSSTYRGDHPEVIFVVSDQDEGCDPSTESGDWTCSDTGGDSCACKGVESAAIYEGISNCTFCGNGIEEDGEECDGGDKGFDVEGGCNPDCTRPICGNGVIEYNEQCDPPTPTGCSQVCEDEGFCGDGNVDSDEDCDCGPVNTQKKSCTDKCMSDCSFRPRCGDGIVQTGEQCDGGTVDVAGCNSTCHIDSVCGNEIVEIGEECDPPGSASCNNECQKIKGGGVHGDPHFKTWAGTRYDFHGECDLILFSSSKFKAGLGVDLHIRTTMRRDMSYISNAALRIGTDVLEVASKGVYYLNGVPGAAMPNKISGFHIAHSQPNANQMLFEVDLGEGELIKIKTYKDFVSIMVDGAETKDLGDVVGLMGALEKGAMLARDGSTVLANHDTFGQEWQVLDTEPKIFQTNRLPQHPMQCTMPSTAQTATQRRRLSEFSKGTEIAAEKACAHWGVGKDDCVFDVLTTGDLEMAVLGDY
jgi:cysteine-rich repeat protein